ncbi:hypothetical protein [Streptomyces sp. NBRC 109706]|uniref:hypothetical protein n=1 Tax=Streptomyces sp. NBRC 109706 TaxID=1550035 RepID=UPI000780A545|nr:hypothetical protein [Streptomyces sp. NBRC 109706]
MTTYHYVSDTHPARVTGADRYRLPIVGYLTPAHPRFDEMTAFLADEHKRPDGYGLIFLESEEHSALYFGPIEQVQQYQAENADGTATFDQRQGHIYEFWPEGSGWADYIPNLTWHPDGRGILTTHPHPDGNSQVIVYEYHGSRSPNRPDQPLVTYHCTRCHANTLHDIGHVQANTGPNARRWAGKQARQHVLSAQRHGVGTQASLCRPSDPQMSRIVAQVASDMFGRTVPETSWESGCATNGPCAEIRHLRAHAANATAG